MLIGVDGTCWANERGYGRFAREVVRAMVPLAPDDEFRFFVDDVSQARFHLDAANAEYVSVKTTHAAVHAASSTGYRLPTDMLAMTRAVARNKCDVFFSPSVYTYFPLPPRLPAVITIHDAIAERFPSLTLPSLRSRLFWAIKLKMALAQATRILTVSDYAADDIARIHRVPRTRIDVAKEAASGSFSPTPPDEIRSVAAKTSLACGDRWFIYVGGFNPHKNIESIIRAHASVASAFPENPPRLLLVGTLEHDVFYGSIARAKLEIERAGTASLVRWTGFVPDEELSALMSGAIALLLPSSAEGFGLPAVEAAACGTPVIATRESPLPELLAGAGVFVTPGNDKELADAMTRVAGNNSVRDELSRQALIRSHDLTWEKCAQATLSSLRAAAA
jgi:glycosyltransferase involved in cell wall biosynthesis